MGFEVNFYYNPEKAATFWRRQAAELGLPFTVIRPAGLPICIITLRGSKPDLPSIMLNSHSDVVPAEPVSNSFKLLVGIRGYVGSSLVSILWISERKNEDTIKSQFNVVDL